MCVAASKPSRHPTERRPSTFTSAVVARPAFTLIELLVVVSMIVLLVALLLPALGAARDEARAVQCASAQRQWANAFASYRQDNRFFQPVFADRYDVTGADTYEPGTFWFNTAGVYLGLEDIPPGMTRAQQQAISSRNYSSPLRQCPTSTSVWIGVHYGGFNSTKPSRAPINYGRNVTAEDRVLYATHNDKSPSKWMLLCDTNAHYIYTPNIWVRTIDADLDGEPDSHAGVLGGEGSIHYYNRGRPTVHRGGGVYAFIDTHTERLPFSDWLNSAHSMWTGK